MDVLHFEFTIDIRHIRQTIPERNCWFWNNTDEINIASPKKMEFKSRILQHPNDSLHWLAMGDFLAAVAEAAGCRHAYGVAGLPWFETFGDFVSESPVERTQEQLKKNSDSEV